MTAFLAYLLARLIDPVAILLCCGSAAMIGEYRVAVPIGAVIYGALMIGLGSTSLVSISTSIIAGAALSALGLFAWRRVPDRFKSWFIR